MTILHLIMKFDVFLINLLNNENMRKLQLLNELHFHWLNAFFFVNELNKFVFYKVFSIDLCHRTQLVYWFKIFFVFIVFVEFDVFHFFLFC